MKLPRALSRPRWPLQTATPLQKSSVTGVPVGPWANRRRGSRDAAPVESTPGPLVVSL